MKPRLSTPYTPSPTELSILCSLRRSASTDLRSCTARASEPRRARNSSRASLLNRHSIAPALKDSLMTRSEYVPVITAESTLLVRGSFFMRRTSTVPGSAHEERSAHQQRTLGGNHRH